MSNTFGALKLAVSFQQSAFSAPAYPPVIDHQAESPDLLLPQMFNRNATEAKLLEMENS